MKKSFYVLGLLPCVVAAVMLMTSCSSPEKKTEDFIRQLGENSKVLATNLMGDDKEIIASIQPDNSTVSVVKYSIESEKVDTIISLPNDEEFVDAVKADNGYLFITRSIGKFSDLRRPYSAYFVGNDKNAEDINIKKLLVDMYNECLTCSGYVIDKEAKVLTLTSDDADDSNVTLYLTEYDFDGNQVAEDPLTYDLKPKREYAESNATYLWECQECGEKRNAAERPSGWDCMRPGYVGGMSHKWVKIGRVD